MRHRRRLICPQCLSWVLAVHMSTVGRASAGVTGSPLCATQSPIGCST
jgi:hypothetical protein